jgi:hypothetical protein
LQGSFRHDKTFNRQDGKLLILAPRQQMDSPGWDGSTDKTMGVAHFSRLLREVGLLVFICHRLLLDARCSFSRCLGDLSDSLVAEACALSPAVAAGGKRFWIRRNAATSSLKSLERVRQKYCFVVIGYVVMPEHFHLLLSEPEKGTLPS